jgi:hypothetical protein
VVLPTQSGLTARGPQGRCRRGLVQRCNTEVGVIALRCGPPLAVDFAAQRAREIFRLLTRPAPIDDYGDLRPARQAKNITLATRRHSFGVPLMTVSRLERGHQRNDTLANNYRQWLTAA